MSVLKELAKRSLFSKGYEGVTDKGEITKYTSEDVKEALKKEIKSLTGTRYGFEKNRYTIYEMITEVYDEIYVPYFENYFMAFAEVDQVPNEQKKVYKIRKGRQRAKQFITRVALNGMYDTFRLDNSEFELSTYAIGGAGRVDFYQVMMGREDLTEVIDIILEGIQEAVFGELQKALIASTNNVKRPTANTFSGTAFDEAEMKKLETIAKTYGGGKAVIFAPPEFIADMGPSIIGHPISVGVGGTGAATPVYNPKHIQEIAETGLIRTFGTSPIIEIPQSYTDETNTTTTTNPGIAYIFPAGKEKVVKLLFEGGINISDWQNKGDESYEVKVTQKVGVGIISLHNWCTYVNTALADGSTIPTKYPKI